MPFTLAHPAAALPLRRPLGRLAVPSALVIGSIVPDFAYCVFPSVVPAQSHSLLGLLTFCLPVGLVMYGGFHLLVTPLLMALLPLSFRSRCPVGWSRGVLPEAAFGAIVVSLLLGSVTHIVWDSFTHEYGAAARVLPVLASPLWTWEGYTVTTLTVLQHASTVLGFTLLGSWGLRWLRETPPRAESAGPSIVVRLLLLTILLGPPIVVAFIAGWNSMGGATGSLGRLQLFVGHAIVPGGSVFLIGVPVVGAIWRMLTLRRA